MLEANLIIFDTLKDTIDHPIRMLELFDITLALEHLEAIWMIVEFSQLKILADK